MAQPGREDALRILEEDRGEVLQLLAKLSDDERTREDTIGGGDWSAKDLLGHIAFWEELALQTIADWRAGRRPAVEQFAEAGQEAVDRANADNQARTVAQSLAETRARAAASHAAVVQAIGSLSDDE